jgi:tetratricopeptide (TPR) repeat protein
MRSSSRRVRLLFPLTLLLAAVGGVCADDDSALAAIDALLERGAAAAALERAESLLASPDLEPRNAWRGRQRLAAALLALGRPAEAIPALEAALADAPREAALHLSLGRAWRDRGQAGRAVASYQRALDLAPSRPLWRLEYAEVLGELGARRDAAREIDAARELCGDCRPALLAAADLALTAADHEAAIEPLQRLHALGAESRVRGLLVAALWNAGRPAAVAAVLDTVPGARLSGEEMMVLVQVERRLGRSARAVAWARGEADDLPSGWSPPADFWAIAAEICLGAGEPAAALQALDRALDLRPGVALYHHNRAAALVALGRDGEARRALATARRLDPGLGESP